MRTSLDLSCPVPLSDYDRILLAHGGGGTLSQQLLLKSILPAFTNPHLAPLHDGAILDLGGVRIAFSTDSYVVSPRFFPGGSIGELAVHGTVNDLAMCGAVPQFLSVGFILEEGFPREDLERIARAMRAAADAAGVLLVTGDTKVVEQGKGDGIFINTSGIGIVREGIVSDPRTVRPGDKIILSGDIARHGIAIMSVREGLEFDTALESDMAPLHEVAAAVCVAAPDLRVMRDPTRGGVASALNEIAASAGVGMEIDERRIPVWEAVHAACEILGFDPLYVANEGKMIAIVPPGQAESVVKAMRRHPAAVEAAIIGEVTADHPGTVVLRTSIGGKRVVDMLSGEQLPRIC
ncbi:MAG: hydrogenase expression/formation protein HypE [Bacteroidota bacterium]